MEKIGFNTIIGIVQVISQNNKVVKIILNSEICHSKDLFLNDVKKELIEYFNSEREYFSFDIDIKTTKFKTKIYTSLKDTQIGTTISYKQLAARINSNAVRACASAMSTNLIPIVIPCHRVINHNGSLGKYHYGSKLKQKIISIERRYKINKCCSRYFFTSKQIAEFNDFNLIIKPVKSFYYFNDLFSAVIVQIIYQQINYNTARKIEENLFWKFDYKITPQNILSINDNYEYMINISKLNYLKNVAASFIENDYTKFNKKEVLKYLMSVKGIGTWTIQMIEIFYYHEQNIFSDSDLILKKIKNQYLEEEIKNEDIKTLTSLSFWNHYLQ